MKLLLIRHGETTGDVEGRYGGNYDDHLTRNGQQQLEETAHRLAGRQIDTMYVSPLKRALESAEIISKQLDTRTVPTDGLRERDYGVLGGLTKVEAAEKYPEAVRDHADPAHTDPEGESLEAFTSRVAHALNRIIEQGGETIALVTHGGPIKVILRHLNQPIPDRIGDGEIREVDLSGR